MEIVQFITYFLTILSFLLYTDLHKRLVHKRMFFVPILLYLFHVLIFYSMRILTTHTGFLPNYLEYFTFTNWSSAIRLQAVLTIFIFAFIMGKYDRKLFSKIQDIFRKLRG